MPGQNAHVVDQEVEGYDIDDLFMSRTDKQGIIQSGNATFTRLSGYCLTSMIGKPHKMVRHPDMPRGVFAMMWSWLNKGHPFVGYVKNRASDGRNYWVLAAVMPLQDGYVSVRIKPSTDLFETAKQVYADLLRREREERLSPEQSLEEIRKAIQAMGFVNYRHFACESLTHETAAARQRTGAAPIEHHETYLEIAEKVMQLNGEVKTVVESFDRIQGSPANLSIQGSRLDEGSAAVKVIAQNYGLLSDHLRLSINAVLSALDELNISAQQGQMYSGAQWVYRQALAKFEGEPWPEGAPPKDQEMEILRDAETQIDAEMKRIFRAIDEETRTFVDSISKLRMQASGLAVTRVMCNIEAATVTGDTSGLIEITRRLNDFQANLSTALDTIQGINATLMQQLSVVTKANDSSARVGGFRKANAVA